MKLKNLFFAAAAVLGVVACQNKPSVAEGVTVDPAEITFAKEGETKEVTITTADEWKLSVPDDEDGLFVCPARLLCRHYR